MNIDTATEIKLKLRVSVPGWPEKTCHKKPRGEKSAGNLRRARYNLRPPLGLQTNYSKLRQTKAELILMKPVKVNTGKSLKLVYTWIEET